MKLNRFQISITINMNGTVCSLGTPDVHVQSDTHIQTAQ